MNLPSVQPSEPTSSQATAFSNQLKTTDAYHSFQVFIPKGNEKFDLQRLISDRKVIKNKLGIPFSTGKLRKKLPLRMRVQSDKPENAFWTCTLKKDPTSSKSTTAWIEWCRENGLNFWLGTSAAQFKVSETAKIFNIDSTEKYEYLLKNVPHAEDDNYIDWERVATEFDAVHCTEDFYIPGWDCESTAWFNRDKLAFQKSISSQEIDL